MHKPGIAILGAAALLIAGASRLYSQSSETDLSGLWGAQISYGEKIHGTVILQRDGKGWIADIGGFRVVASLEGRTISFSLPDDKGRFRGRASGRDIAGHWFWAKTTPYATPLILRADGLGRWRGEVVSPPANTFTFYMPMSRRADGTYATYLRNPERNQGRFIQVSSVRANSDGIELVGRRGDQPDALISRGVYEDGVIHATLNGSSYDFLKVEDTASSPFYPRGKPGSLYTYTKPLQFDDGWSIASPEEVGISRDGITRLVQMLIDMPMDSITTPQVHSILIARHGKLVVDEYFHGYDRSTPHDLRSASKSWSAILIGAAMHSGIPIRATTPVYQTMLGSLPVDLDPRKRAMTLEHLISMTAGYDCAADDAPGNEDVMQAQAEDPDWIHYTLNVPLLSAPGDTIVYCSIEPNLALGMLKKIANEPLPEMFDRLVARPMRMGNYHLFLSPTGDVYGGGGHHFLSRDFLKFAQLMLNEGKWNGREIISRDWAIKSGSALRRLNSVQRYGWLWNSVEYDYNGRKVRAIFAGGNGGQVSMAIPELDLVIAFTGGNYAQAASFTSQREFIPKYILPAISRR